MELKFNMYVNFILKHKTSILISILFIINSVMSIFDDQLLGVFPVKTEYVNLFFIMIWALVETYDKIHRDIEIKKISVTTETTLDTVNDMSHKVNTIDNEISKYNELKEKKYESAKFLSKLINENLITINTISKLIPDKKFISVLCYQNSMVAPKEIKLIINRKYPQIFDNLGFVRLANQWPYWPYFIIAESNIFPKKLRDIDALAKYLITKGKIAIDDEWNKTLELSKEKNYDFYEDNKNKDNPNNLNMLISKTSIRDMRHCFIKSNYFNPQFNLELASIIEANKLNLSNENKIRIKNFVLQSSMDILVEGILYEDKEKILLLEEKFKKPFVDGGLNITNFFDYHKRNKNDILNILLTSFDEKDAKRYSDLIVSNSKQCEDLLLELGIGQ